MHYDGHKIRVSCTYADQLYDHGSFVCDTTGVWLKGRINNDCPEGFIRVPPLNASCYHFGTIGLSFNQAQVYCQRYNSHLVFIETEQENAALVKYIKTNKIDDTYLIGLTDLSGQNTDWVWQSGNGTTKQKDFLNWYEGEPNNYNGIPENCVSLIGRDQQLYLYGWFDVPCNGNRSPICEIET